MLLHSLQATTSIYLYFLCLIICFYKASFRGHTDAIELLLKRGANIEVKETSVGATPLYAGNNLN